MGKKRYAIYSFFFVLNILSFWIKIGLLGFEWNSKRFTDIPKMQKANSKIHRKCQEWILKHVTMQKLTFGLWLGNYSKNSLSIKWFYANFVDFLRREKIPHKICWSFILQSNLWHFLEKLAFDQFAQKKYSHILSNLLLFELISIIDHFDKVSKCWLQHNSSCINVQPICKVFETYLS